MIRAIRYLIGDEAVLDWLNRCSVKVVRLIAVYDFSVVNGVGVFFYFSCLILIRFRICVLFDDGIYN